EPGAPGRHRWSSRGRPRASPVVSNLLVSGLRLFPTRGTVPRGSGRSNAVVFCDAARAPGSGASASLERPFPFLSARVRPEFLEKRVEPRPTAEARRWDGNLFDSRNASGGVVPTRTGG